MRLVITFSVFLGVLFPSKAEVELLKNADFESSSFSGNWHCSDCRMTVHTENKYHGSQCVMISNRHHDWSGVRQSVVLEGGQWYVAKAYIRLLNMPPGVSYITVELMAHLTVNGHPKFATVGQIHMQQEKFGWTEVGGDFLTPDGTTSAYLYVQVHNATVNYLHDFSSVQKISTNSNWKSEAHARINSLRKAPITVRLANGASATGISIELKQQKHSFGFGAGVVASMMTDTHQVAYQDFVYKHFEWAVIVNALKWRLMEWTKGHINFDRPVNAIKVLQAHGIKIRGHNMFWGVDGHSPAWLQGMTPAEYITEMKLHVQQVISHTRGTLEHWDVNNENQHGDYFERHTGDPDITAKMFQWIHSQEPGVKLFINEYNVITNSQCTTATRNQAIQLLNMSIPVSFVGIQGHFHSSDINIDVVKYRLDKVAEAGLKIWITELTVSENDANKKAVALENLMTLFFSHPAVEGIMLWGFWDGAIHNAPAKLFEGPNLTPNAAGQVYLDLVEKSWKTDYSQTISPHTHLSTTGFLGDYVLNVKRDGHVIHQEPFSVDQSGKHVTVHLTGDHDVSHVAFG
eukprot:XP_011441801.1 PREDICTED: uncharacterized protein LOC105338397 isoform X1 [Crassostrea gigas]